MFINIDDVLNNYCTLNDKVKVAQMLYDAAISKQEFELKKLKSLEENTEDIRLREICKQDINSLTEDEKQLIYKEYKSRTESMNVLLNAIGIETEVIPPYKNVELEDLEKYKILLSGFVESSKKSSKIERKEKEIEENKYYKDNYVMLTVSKDLFFKHTKEIQDMCINLLESGKKIKFSVEEDMRTRSNDTLANYLYSAEEFENLIEFNNTLRLCGMEENIRINEMQKIETRDDYKNCWDLSTVLNANKAIDKLVNEIKRKNLTPYEAMLYIHKHITSNFAYKQSTLNKDSVIMGAFVDGSIICSGYSSLTKAIIDRLNYPELKCDIVSCKLLKNGVIPKVEGSHCQCVIHIKDKEYNIDGSYLNDACWDSKNPDFTKGKGFTNCLLPLKDAMHFKNTIYYQVVGKSRYDQLIINEEEYKKSEEDNAMLKDLLFRIKSKYKRPIPQFVQQYGEKSDAIPFDKFKMGIENMFYKITGMKKCEKGDKIIEKMIDDTLIYSSVSFDKNATNSFYRQALKDKPRITEELKDRLIAQQKNKVKLDAVDDKKSQEL